LITGALRFVDEFAPDILAADQRQRDYHARARVGRHGYQRDTAVAVQSYLDSHVRDDRPLPGYQGHPNIQLIATGIGCSDSALHRRYRDTSHQAATTVGTTDDIWLDIPIHGRLDGAPWISDVALHLPPSSIPSSRRANSLGCCILPAISRSPSCPGCAIPRNGRSCI
jgi:AraC-like DNA-binding protein